MIITEEAYLETNVDEFLEHHGVLGMHWGRRKTEVSGEPTYSPSKPSHRARNVAIATGIVGVAATALILKHRSDVNLRSIEKTRQFNEGLKLLEENKNVRIAEAVKKIGPARPGDPEYKAALYMIDEANQKHTLGVAQLRNYLEAK